MEGVQQQVLKFLRQSLEDKWHKISDSMRNRDKYDNKNEAINKSSI